MYTYTIQTTIITYSLHSCAIYIAVNLTKVKSSSCNVTVAIAVVVNPHFVL